MRVSSSYQYGLNQSEMNRTYASYIDAQKQVTTGKRINSLSDDPLGATTSISMRSLKSQLTQYSQNLTQAKGYLGFTDNALGEAATMMNSAYQIAVNGANSTNDQNVRNTMVTQINDLQNRLVDLGNSKGPNGQYLFAGQKTDTQPFSVTNGALSYAGDGNTISVETGPTSQMAVNIPGNALFTSIYDQLDDLKTNLTEGDLTSISSENIKGLKDALESLARTRGDIGAKMQSIGGMDAANERRAQELTTGISDVEEVDITQAIVDMKQAETAYQAALTITSQANKMSLLDFIR